MVPTSRVSPVPASPPPELRRTILCNTHGLTWPRGPSSLGDGPVVSEPVSLVVRLGSTALYPPPGCSVNERTVIIEGAAAPPTYPVQLPGQCRPASEEPGVTPGHAYPAASTGLLYHGHPLSRPTSLPNGLYEQPALIPKPATAFRQTIPLGAIRGSSPAVDAG